MPSWPIALLVIWVWLHWMGGCIDGKTRPPREYDINLDLPPNQRFATIARDHKASIVEFHSIIKNSVPGVLLPYVEEIAADLDRYLGPPYADEIRGISSVLNSSLGDLVLLNLLYELSAFCTSIVAEDSNGQIWHARNFDYHLSDMLRDITIVAHFKRKGKTIYSAVTFADYVGILTGQKPSAFTVSIDQRDRGAWWMNAIEALKYLLSGTSRPMSFLIRETLEHATTFSEAMKELSETETIASMYFIVGGINSGEGAVITKGRLDAIDIWYLDTETNRWYLVETNYDHWLPPPESDNRRTPANKMMSVIGRFGVSVKSLFHLLSTPPILRKITTYSVVMSAVKPDIMQAWIQYYNVSSRPSVFIL